MLSTVEDLSLDPRNLLKACEERLRHGWEDLPLGASPARTIAGLCRRLIDAERTSAAAKNILARLCDTVETTGGVFLVDDGFHVPVGDRDWVDLGACYLDACLLLERQPEIVDEPESDSWP